MTDVWGDGWVDGYTVPGIGDLKLEAAFGFGPNEVPHRAVAVGGDEDAEGGGGVIRTSSDGGFWTARDITDSGLRPAAVAWSDDDGALAVGDDATVRTSDDGRTWSAPISTDTTTDRLLAVVHADSLGLWVAAGQGGRIQTAADPAGTWTVRTTPTSDNVFGIGWSGSLLVAVGAGGLVWTSDDAVTWTEQASGTAHAQLGVAWSPELGLWVSCGNSESILTSPDGETWTARTSPLLEGFNTAAWSPELGLWVVAGTTGFDTPSRLVTSPDGVTWTARTVPSDGRAIKAVVWASALGQFVGVGAGGLLVTSTDGVSWTARTSGTAQTLTGVAWSPEFPPTDLTDRMRVDPGVTWAYGRSSELDRIVAGQGSIRLDNRDRALDPSNDASPFWPDVRPMVRLTLTVDDGTTVYPVFVAYTEGWGPGWPGMADAIVDVPLVDGFKLLSMARTSAAYPEQTSGARINALLDAAGWPTLRRDIDVGQSSVQPYDASQRIILNAIQDASATEDGIFYISPDGCATFRNRHRRVLDTSLATFGDAGAELRYRELSAPFDDTTIWNDIAVDPDGLTVQRAEDDASQRSYGRRLLERTTLHTTELEASDLAHWLRGRYATPEQRIDAIVVQGHRSDDLLVQILERRLGHRITVKRRPPGNGDPMSLEVHIEQVSHQIGAGTWETAWRLSPARVEAMWLWGAEGFSEWGQTTRWGY